MITKDAFIAELRRHIGTRFKHQGRDHFGLDCAGLVVYSAKNLGHEIEDYLAYTRIPDSKVFFEYISRSADRVALDDRRMGNLLIFEFDSNPQHVAVITQSEPAYIIHAAATNRKVVEHRLDERWGAKIKAVFRPKILTD